MDFSHFEQIVEERVKDRLDKYDKILEEKLSKYAIEKDVTLQLSRKASSHEYGFMKKEIADLRVSLDPLIDRKAILRSLIDKVIAYDIKTTTEKEFMLQMDKLEMKMHSIVEDFDYQIRGYCNEKIYNLEKR